MIGIWTPQSVPPFPPQWANIFVPFSKCWALQCHPIPWLMSAHSFFGDRDFFSKKTCKQLPATLRYCSLKFTLPETNIAPENGWFPTGISSSNGPFSGAMLVFGEYNQKWMGLCSLSIDRLQRHF